ncbi:hypothetical protein H257_13255 [Aphanomyces astaci]|uniref:Uncharacterized protein n=1 Tax=Aphanomyces astaci TaxID=112090 RepID=W4FWN9_APHAT|nr:hypothetical protein H257_13255 [Aphanomyces astaci]ETV71356.1 hypothetical protein H257_13255 [Aphanomyces astaci]|eukprot:XP_009839021.1 hypothetical protein H257_13255 [Aphanomyces astaci]
MLVALFQGENVKPTQLTYACAKMEVRGTVDEVAELFYPDDEPLANLRRLFPARPVGRADDLRKPPGTTFPYIGWRLNHRRP